MTRTRSLILAVAAVVVVVVVVVVVSSGGSDNSTANASTPKTSSGHEATVGVASTGLGSVLVDAQGRTLYLFEKDQGTTSACSGACAASWPPLRASGTPVAGSGAKDSLLGTTQRSDGQPQVTYDGHPVYLYVGDQKAGDTNGQAITAFGGSWYALTPSGSQVTGSASGSSGGNGY